MKKEEIIRTILTEHGYASTWQGKELISAAERIWNAALTLAANNAEPKATFEEPDKTINIKSGDWFVSVDKESIIKHKF